MTFFIGYMLSPFLAFLLIAFIARPVSNWLRLRLPEGRLKNILLFSWRV